MSAPRCDQCRHWKTESTQDWTLEAIGFGECRAVRPRWKIEDQIPEEINRYAEPLIELGWDEVNTRWAEAQREVFTKARAYVQDGSEYRAEFITGPDFFCALFEAKQL